MIKNYSLILIVFLCFVLSGYGQVNENFDGFTSGGYGNYAYNNFDINNGLSETTNSRSGRSVRLRDTGTLSNLEYVGTDGNGKDGGVGDISFWYRSWDASPTAVYNVEISINNGTYSIIGSQISTSSTTYAQWTHTLNNSSDNIKVRIIRVSGERLIIDDFEITDFNVTTDLVISGTPTNHGSSCLSTAATTQSYTITNTSAAPALNVAVSSDDAQFVVSGLSSTTIAPSGTATFDVTFTPTTTGAQTATITVSSTTASGSTIDLDGTGITLPTLTQPTDQNEVIPNTATFSVTSSDATSYQWQVDTGTGFNNIAGATTDTYTTTATSAPMDGNQYRCVLTNACGSTTSNAATLNLTNSAPNNVTGIRGCFEDTSVTLDWNAPATGATPTGYMVFALDGGTDPAGAKTDANTYTANANFAAATPVTPASLGRVVYKGAATTATITGLTEDNNYSFTTYGYVGESLTGWANGATGGSTVTNGLAQGDVRNLIATPLTNQVTLNWLNPLPTSCWDDILIVANQGAVAFTPSGNGSAYTANPVYSGANQVVYKGSANSVAVTGLTNGISYCFRAYIRRGTTWTAGVEVCAVPSLTYCASNGNGSDGYFTLINNVEFNTINNPSPVSVDNAYSDFTGISTTVTLGESYNLDVRVETDGAFTTTTRAWIDWNNDGDFNDFNEEYELGNAYNVIDGSTDASPLAIEVPTNAVIAATRMRVSTRFNTTAATSCQTGYDGEVEDYTINITQPATAEINIKGNNITIPNGFNDAANGGLNQTLYGLTNVGAAGPTKTYTIENIGATVLNLTGAPRVEIIGAHAGDFTVTVQPAASVTYGTPRTFSIQFFPTADGIRTATVSIINSDSDEDPYLFDIQGSADCSTASTSTIWPSEGPENTEVTITSANNLTGASATINGLAMTTISSSATELVVLVPAGATDGNITVQFTTGCSSNNTIDVLDNVIGTCDTATASTVPSDLFITEISDATSGSSSLIEIFNGTAGTINLNNYSIRIFNNGSGTPSTTANLVGSLAPGAVHVISIGTTTCDLSGNGLAGGLPNQSFNSAGGINFDNNSSDAIELYNSSTAMSIDVFGELGSNTWANGLGIGDDGINYRRQNTASPLPSTTFDLSQWDEIDWTTCGDSDYSDFGVYDFSLGVPPGVTYLNPPVFNCTSNILLSITGSEGVPAGQTLTYQWYYLAPSTSTFVVVPNNADFDDVTTNILDIVNPLGYDNYQFYCQVRENSATCYQASNAVKLEIVAATWDGTNWNWDDGTTPQDTLPNSSTLVVLNGNYDTSVGGVQTSFSACSLIVNSTFGLDIPNSTYIEIENDIVANGDITVFPQGSVVQINDLATVSGSGTITVQKETSMLNTPYDYTYWSSPVAGETVENVFANVPATRRYIFNAANFEDLLIETNNSGTFTSGQDDIDDNGDDWEYASGTMLPGVGYAATPSTVGPSLPVAQQFPFVGPFNNGVFTPSVVYVSSSPYSDWNFIGNPYPSAIDTNVFFTVNSGVTDAIYLWSQATLADANASGNEGYNFSGADYAVISASGVNTAGGDTSLIPNDYVPSGQGFFIETQSSGAITFNNSMRVTGNNDQFFREANPSLNNRNVLWLNLHSDNGVANQLAVAHLQGATDGFDGSFYDVKRNVSTQKYAKIYSVIEGSDTEYVIQGKNPSSLSLDEIIKIGFNTFIESATTYTISIAQFEGEFYTDNAIYLKDNLLNTIDNLKNSDYSFTSETGVFNDRFEIVFTPTTLSIADNLVDANDLTITELLNGEVQFRVGKKLQISNVMILDVLGRQIYNLQGSNATEVYNLSKLSNAAYIAKVKLSNGQVISKKAIKQH